MMGGVDAPAMDTEHGDEATFMSELLPDIPEKNQVVVQWRYAEEEEEEEEEEGDEKEATLRISFFSSSFSSKQRTRVGGHARWGPTFLQDDNET